MIYQSVKDFLLTKLAIQNKPTVVVVPGPVAALSLYRDLRGGSRNAATSKMERFVIIVNGFQPLTIITKRSILDVAAVLDPPLDLFYSVFSYAEQFIGVTFEWT